MPRPGLLQRIKTYVNQLPSKPAAQVGPGPQPGLIQRMRDKSQEVLEYGVAEALLPEGPATTLAMVKVRIQKAARTRTKLRILYLGSHSSPGWRSVEPYSFRYRDKDSPHIPQLFAHQDGDTHIKAFKLYRIEDARTTPYPFVPKWTVELG